MQCDVFEQLYELYVAMQRFFIHPTYIQHMYTSINVFLLFLTITAKLSTYNNISRVEYYSELSQFSTDFQLFLKCSVHIALIRLESV